MGITMKYGLSVAGGCRAVAAIAVCAAGVLAVSLPAWAADSAALAKRVQQLEEQLVDMQVVIGTLETMNSGGGVGPAPAAGYGPVGAPAYGGGGADSARLDGMETQIRALTAQIEQLSREVRSISAGRRGSIDRGGPSYAAAPQVAGTQQRANDAATTYGGFGSTTVTRGAEDGIGGFLSRDGGGAGVGGGDPKQAYEQAYGYLLQEDYGAAETAFKNFLVRYPNHGLAGNAQYWLGESHYVRGEYKPAASAFLEGYEKYRKNAKAPDSLLKLAMSLDRLGQRDAACSSYSELASRYPNAPPHVKRRAQSERRRAGC
ncbi:MAG: tol-pal system protein YbgF [Alphaproteobacteria bacterium]|nr:tol-pal system protein YbgF [Alphaproteobacteria bacterium]